MEIDLVYLWVDGNDPAWLAKKRAFTGEFREGGETDSSARYTDNSELKYSLRSAEKYAPWIRRIFIVTDGQTPEWLDTSNPRISVVDHKQILPPEALPSFNSALIELFLYKIPGLAERFLYANDDMFFAAPVAPAFFFDPADGYPIVRQWRKSFGRLRWRVKLLLRSGVGHYRRKIVRSAGLVESVTGKRYWGVPHHNIDSYLKSDFRRAVEEIFPDSIAAMLPHRVRTDGDIQRVAVLFWALATGRAHLKYVDNRTSLRIKMHKPDFAGKISGASPEMFCLNDSQRTRPEDRLRVKPFLESLFPERSAFEL
jgi:hypothetical protein